MNAAIEYLRIKLDELTTNEPIHRGEGRTREAARCREEIEEITRALDVLNAIQEIVS